jgi:hypothetical protein
MNMLANNRQSQVKEMSIAQNLIVVHKKQFLPQNQNPHEKYKSWVMPPQRERYIKHKKHDPL